MFAVLHQQPLYRGQEKLQAEDWDDNFPAEAILDYFSKRKERLSH